MSHVEVLLKDSRPLSLLQAPLWNQLELKRYAKEFI